MSGPGNPEPPTYLRAARYVAERVTTAIAGVPVADVQRAVRVLAAAPATFVYGAGRSGIVGRAFAMRLVQTGLTAYVIGESVTPIVKRGDAVFIVSGQGGELLQPPDREHRAARGRRPDRAHGPVRVKLAHAATVLVTLEFGEDADRPRYAPLGTLFEAASLRLTDGIVAELMAARGETERRCAGATPSWSDPGRGPLTARRRADAMRMRTLGRNGPTVSAIGLGCMGMSQSYGIPDETGGRATLDRALELGITFFDTADIYGPTRTNAWSPPPRAR
ncbi:6-phospho 3-hexuloisomerase, partial [mine drainage metagenome]